MIDGELKIYPLGGVGEIGSNMTVFETTNHILVVDYGILFPSDDFFDINYLIVDTKSVPTDKEVTLFITHGHEDHIGAIHHFVVEFPNANIYAPNFAIELIRNKLEPRKINRKIQEYNQTDIINFDGFELHPVHVTHSIPCTFGLVLKNSSKSFACLFISDFKYDLKPTFEEPFNIEKIKSLFSDTRIKLAMLDSTNIMNPGKTHSESEVTDDLRELISNNKRTFITLFSSNIHRVRNILELASKAKKTVTTIGRSINSYLDAAESSSLLKREDYKIKDLDAIQNYNDPNLVYIVTGSQGEHLGATRRIIIGEQKNITLNPSDQFIFSSKPIPGNEKKIYKLYNQLASVGCDIITFKDKLIHASGHPCKEDIKTLVGEINPTHYIPIHGETYFLKEHIKFIKSTFPHIETIFLTNYEGVQFKEKSFNLFRISPIDPHLIHGKDIPIEREKVSERRKLACNGLAVISVNYKSHQITLETRGLPVEADNCKSRIIDMIDFQTFSQLKNRDHDYIKEELRIKVRNTYKSFLGYKPITIINIV